ncbi:MAG: PAS domain S-box protein [Deltaproteobacteria bacterium]|nr:PAS domain S-box protein [Deltaproteobacteria bacterium]
MDSAETRFLIEQLKTTHALLEQRVTERTRELQDANRQLQLELAEHKRTQAAFRLDEQRLEALLELSQMTRTSLHELADFCLKEAVRLTGSEVGYIAFVNEEETVLTMHAWSESAMKGCGIADQPIEYPLEKTGLWGEAVRQRRPIITNDYAAPSPLRKGLPEGHVPISRHLNIPVFDDDHIVAVLGVGNKGDEYDDSDVRQLTLLMDGMWRIVRRRKAEEILDSSETKYRLMTENMKDVIWQATPDMVFTYVSPSCERMLGYPQDELVARSMFDFIAPQTPHRVMEGIREQMQRVRTSGISANPVYELELRRKDGVTILTEVLPCPIFDQDGNMEGYQGVTRDITERRQAEKAMQESEERYRVLFNSITDALLVHEINADDASHGRFVGVNDIACQRLGYSREELLTLSPADIDAPACETGVDTLPIMRHLATGQNVIFEQVHVARDGRRIPVEINARMVTLQGRSVNISLVRDISERRQADEERKRLEAQLAQAQKMESIGTLAGGIAHDFNNILSAIIGFTELALDDVSEPAKAKRELGEVLKAGDRAKGLVSQILAFSRKTETKYSPVALRTLIKESLRMLRPVLPTTIEIRQNLMDSGLVMADSTQIHQVMMNLCTNAAHAMEEKGGVIEVSLKKVNMGEAGVARDLDLPCGNYLMLSVCDTGHGMTPEVMARIYDPYFTTKELGRGTGLGLSVVHGIVKSHKGELHCTSSPGKGTAFDIYLPEIEPGRHAAQAPAEEPFPTGTGRILFIDDEQTLTALAGKMLGKLGYDVITKTSSAEALGLFREDPERFDLVITDMTMPGMTGDRLAQELMQLRHDIPIILCTGYSANISEERAKAMGIREYILKPLDLRTLDATIRKVLAGA